MASGGKVWKGRGAATLLREKFTRNRRASGQCDMRAVHIAVGGECAGHSIENKLADLLQRCENRGSLTLSTGGTLLRSL